MWEVWIKAYPNLPTPKDALEAEMWQYKFCNGDYLKLIDCAMPDGTISDPGPWLAEVLNYWDSRKNGKANLRRWWNDQKEYSRKQKERELNEQREAIKYYKPAIKRGLEDKFGGGHITVHEPAPKRRLVVGKA